MTIQAKYVSPSVKETAFNCPHCGALTTQFWYLLKAEYKSKGGLPFIIDAEAAKDEFLEIQDLEQREKMTAWFRQLATGRPLLKSSNDTSYSLEYLYNVHVSRCYNCNEIAVWIFDRLIYPQKGEAPLANPDLPQEILQDYNEASSILDLSPRGAAALIRLCIQKLCKHLGQAGNNVNEDIKALVSAGLDVRVQQALDAVRVIGNNAVHPGHMDLSDDRATAQSLFRLLNLIAEKMISEPKHVNEVYANLPPSALAAIQARDKK